jgi:CelD/BcsL family acetyltransferase involved in cellulose biosynthesis
VRLVACAHAAGFPTAKWRSLDSPWLELADFERALSAKFRSSLRRRARKLEAEVGAIALERVEARGALDEALDDALRLEAAGWKGAARTAIACDAELARRYRALARALFDRLALYFLRVGGVRRASHFALVEDGVYYLFKPGYAPELATYGLGHLLVDAVIRDLRARGVHTLDFLGDDMPWKREWTTRIRRHSFRYIFRPSLRGRLLHALKFTVAPLLRRGR